MAAVSVTWARMSSSPGSIGGGAASADATVFIRAHIAQAAERDLGKIEVIGSNPIVGSTSGGLPG